MTNGRRFRKRSRKQRRIVCERDAMALATDFIFYSLKQLPPVHQTLSFIPLTPESWHQFVELFGSRGACGGCWCMWWRLRRADYNANKGDGNKRKMKALVTRGVSPGLLAMQNGEAVGWIACAPRNEYESLATSRVLRPVDEKPVWSIVCMFVRKDRRRAGVSKRLIQAATTYARKSGARIVEAYPVEPKKDDVPDLFVFTGLASSYKALGFVEVARRSDTRPIMRLELK